MHCGNLQEDKRTIIIINVGEREFMASSKDYLEYILDQLSGLDDIDSVSDDQRTADTISKLKSRYIPACRHVPDNGQEPKTG